MRKNRRAFSRLMFEELEDRRLLALITSAPAPLITPYWPSAVIAAYGANQIPTVNGTAINGAGQTIAIMAVNSQKSASQLASDVHSFDTNINVNLPDPPSVSVIAAPGAASSGGLNTPPPNEPALQGNDEEEDLDVEWAHAMAPGANIEVVIVPLTSGDARSAQIVFDAAMQYAATLPGVSVVMSSYGYAPNRIASMQSTFAQGPTEYPAETTDDSDFVTPSGHQGVTFVDNSGDISLGSYPAMSPNVVAVGGTSLSITATTTTNTGVTPATTTSNYTYNSETYWNAPLGTSGTGNGGEGGTGLSVFESEPAYQSSFQSTGARSVPDVSMLNDFVNDPIEFFYSDPALGAAAQFIATSSTLDTASPAGNVSTSVAAAMFAGLLADANQERVLLGGTTLDGPSQTLPALYQLAHNGDYNPMATVTNISGTTIPTTGLGSPIANLLVPDLAAYGMTSQFAIPTPQTQTITFANQLIGVGGATGTFNLNVDGVNVPVVYPAVPNQTNVAAAIQSAINSAPAPLGPGTTLVSANLNPAEINITFTGSLADHTIDPITFNTGTLNGNSIFGYSQTQIIPFTNSLTSPATGSFNLTVDGVTVSVAYPTAPSAATLAAAVQAALNGAAAPLGSNTTFVAAGPTASTISITFVGALTSTLVPEITGTNGSLSGNGLSAPVQVLGTIGETQTITFTNPLATAATGTFNLIVDGVTIPVVYPAIANQANMITAIQAALNAAVTPLGAGTTVVGPGINLSSITITFVGTLVNAYVPPSTFNNGTLVGNSITAEPLAVAGTTSPFTLEAQNAAGGIDASINGPVFVNGVNVGTMVNGVANVTLTLTQASSTESVPFTVGSLSEPVIFNVVAGAPSQLLITTPPPSSVSVGGSFGVTVTAEDAFGNVANNYAGSATVALLNNPGNSALGGNLVQPFINGVATFGGLTIGNQGSGYTLVLSTQKVSVATPSISVFNSLQIIGNANNSVSIAFPDSTHFTVSINGKTTQYDLSQYNGVIYQGPIGKFSKVVFVDPWRAYAAVQSFASTLMVSSTFSFEADNVSNLFMYSGSSSTATVKVDEENGGDFYVDDAKDGYSYIADPKDQIFSQLIGFGAETVTGAEDTTYAYIYSTSQASIVADPAGTSVTVGGVKTTLGSFHEQYILGAVDGSDQVTLDSQGGQFIGTPTFSYIEGTYQGFGFVIGALYAANITAQASTSGTDTAFFESFPGNAFNGNPTSSSLTGTTLNVLATAYNFVTAANGYSSVAVLESGGGTDVANLTSTGGGVFVGTSTADTLTVGSITITVDTFISTTVGSGTVLVAGASQVNVSGAGNGTDKGYLYDAPGTNALVASGTLATLTTEDGTLSVNNFAALTAVHQSGSTDTLHEDAIDFALTTSGLWTRI